MIKIPVIMSSDNNIIFTAGVALTSLLENAARDTFYEIKFLHPSDVTEDNKNKLLSLRDKYKNMSIELFDMKDEFKDIPTTKGYHVNYVSAYKMCIAQMFPQYDRVLYLDTDIIVRGDLTEFFTFDIGNNYLGGTPAICNILNQKFSEIIIKQTGIPNMDFYINAGVMLMNLKKIREDKIDEKWISMLGSFQGSVDQHILNLVCWGKTAFIPQKFNVCITDIQYYENKEIYSIYSPDVVKEALGNPSIFHWPGVAKPWTYEDTFLAYEWSKYYYKSPFGYKPLKRKRCSILCKKTTRESKFYLFGIPIFKIKNCGNKYLGYLFNLIPICKKKKKKGYI